MRRDSTRGIMSELPLYLGLAFIGVLFMSLLRAALASNADWTCLLSERIGESGRITRHTLLFPTLFLAGFFLVQVLNGNSAGALQLTDGFGAESLMAITGLGYLGGRILPR